jgi:1-acyl-sn-glycerol-3-phosphate acyltransferase
MVYRFLYYFANLIIRIYYRKIHVDGLAQIPTDKPLLIVSNHPNGFLEPIMMACLFPIDLHFLVRGDLFENKALKWLLVSTNQVPIYRFKDGIAALRNNQKTIAKTIEVLNQNKAIIIFPEGSTDGDWHLREFKKGMARMAFQCIDGSPDLDLHILPVGVVFSKSEATGSEVILKAGKAFSIKDFYSKNAKEAKDQMDVMTKYTYDRVKELMIHLDNKSNEKIIRNEWNNFNANSKYNNFLPRINKDNDVFLHLKNVAEKLNSNTFTSSSPKELSRDVVSYFSFLIGIPGMLFFALPLGLGLFITKKYVKQREFVSSVRAASSGFLVLLYLIVSFIVGTILFGFFKTLAILAFFFLSGLFMLNYFEKGFRN